MISRDQSVSLEDSAKNAEAVLLVGVGGGGDVAWSIPLINYLRNLGLNRFAVGEPAIAWWDLEGRIALGGFVFHAEDVDNYKREDTRSSMIFPHSMVSQGAGKGQRLPQSIVAELKSVEAYMVELDDGVQGISKSLHDLASRVGAKLIVGVDCGSDSLYSGRESKVLSPTVDAMIIASLARLKQKTILGLIGYGCDGDLMPDEIDRNLGELASRGGLLGARGLTPKDLSDMEAFFKLFPNPVEDWPLKAAKGEQGWKCLNTLWSIYVSPLSSVMLFLDPKVLVEFNPLANAVAKSKSLKEAEDATISMNLIPETRKATLLPKLLE